MELQTDGIGLVRPFIGFDHRLGIGEGGSRDFQCGIVDT